MRCYAPRAFPDAVAVLSALCIAGGSGCGGGQHRGEGEQVAALPPTALSDVRAIAFDCDEGDRSACAELARRYFDGDGVPHDYARSSELFHFACDEDPVPGCEQFIDTIGEPESPPLSPSQISQALAAGRGPLNTCYLEMVLPRLPDTPIEVRARLDVAPDGSVTSAEVLSSTWGDEFATCIEGRLALLRFAPPSTGERYYFELPIPFDPADFTGE